MARVKYDGKIGTVAQRIKLKGRREPYWTNLEPGRALGYRKISKKPGAWIARLYDVSLNPPRRYHALGAADDLVGADEVDALSDALSFAQAQAKAREWFDAEAEQETGEARQKGPYTVQDAWVAYVKDSHRRGVKGMAQMESATNLHILPALGHIEVAKLTQTRIERWHEELSNASARVRSKLGAKKPATRLSAKTDDEIRARKDTANRILTILKAMLNYAKKKRKTTATGEAWREAKPFKHTTKARIRFLNAEESQRLVNVCEPDFRRLVQGALFTGARFGELTKLEARDFNPESGTLHIDSSISKSGTKRDVVLTDEGQSFLQEVTAGLKGDHLIFTRWAFPDMRRVRPGSQEPMPKVAREWKRGDQNRFMSAACEAAGLEPLSFHELRHTHASSLVNAGVPLAFIAKQLGHANTVMTEKHYGHLAPSAMAEAIRKLAPKLGIHTPGNISGLEIKHG